MADVLLFESGSCEESLPNGLTAILGIDDILSRVFSVGLGWVFFPDRTPNQQPSIEVV